MKQKTPQEKKALSYAKDCRNTYGENDKGARKTIPWRKAKVNRLYRRKANQVLQEISNKIPLEKVELVESAAVSIKREYWKKCSDEPLGKVVERKLRRRETHAGNGKTARKKIREFAKTLKIKSRQETDGRWIAQAIGMNDAIVHGKTREDAIESCKTLANYIFLRSLGVADIIAVGGGFISVVIY